ncbi:MAG: hypothetical protein HY292_04515 [Planctomycetes bacterium]|nr:hypothetical protein [Planctomycetota bacterium]
MSNPRRDAKEILEFAADVDPDCAGRRNRLRLFSGEKASRARLLRNLLEVDPLVCGYCGATMQVIAVITDPGGIDRILHFRASGGCHDSFAGRAPPAG